MKSAGGRSTWQGAAIQALLDQSNGFRSAQDLYAAERARRPRRSS